MDSSALIRSLGVGAALFAGFILLWFIRTVFKRRISHQQSSQTMTAPSEISWEEKRKHPRMAVSWPGRMETDQESKTVQLKDISQGGAFVTCGSPLPLSEKFRLTINAPDCDALTVNAEVVWTNANVPEDKVINRGMGVRFIDNTDRERDGLKQIILFYINSQENNSD
jgi:hypothetical protein